MTQITIIGCGLIGGSFAALVKKYKTNHRIIGIGRRKEPLENAVNMGLIDEYALDINPNKIAKSKYIILATPISTILPLIEQLTKSIKQSLNIIDFSSVKSFLNHPIVTKSHHNIIPVHPMGGREVQGIENADSRVLEYCPLITFDKNNESEINKFFRSCSFNIISCSSYEEHDEWMAYVSHGPYLIANLIPILLSKQQNHNHLRSVIAGGFKDTTRVSGSSIEWGLDILEGNKVPLIHFLTKIEEVIQHLKQDLQNENFEQLKQTLSLAKQTRQLIVDDK
ncbi:MAG: prephenate dehydrogenase [Candidatus Margulisiibacteriota bacterium]